MLLWIHQVWWWLTQVNPAISHLSLIGPFWYRFWVSLDDLLNTRRYKCHQDCRRKRSDNMSVQSLHFQLIDIAPPIAWSGYNLESLHFQLFYSSKLPDMDTIWRGSSWPMCLWLHQGWWVLVYVNLAFWLWVNFGRFPASGGHVVLSINLILLEQFPQQPLIWSHSNQTFLLWTVVILVTGHAHFDAMP